VCVCFVCVRIYIHVYACVSVSVSVRVCVFVSVSMSVCVSVCAAFAQGGQDSALFCRIFSAE